MIRRALLAAVLAVTAFAVIPGAPAQARVCRIDHTCYTTYFSDATHTTVVGGKLETCDGSVSTWGVRTGYIEFEESPC
ncbi:hypothetical protein HNP84_005481 [Thermocatellispora tengchongensis]|uniref:Secreted protein n=1 Tax=Thermocatellispora tengchongensis TaxID=1073253 RepID=A0A840PF09_9ACTN|nr:DUF6289 family protein [Thermocatellispora tengchongensis]MBB5135737.1 hypothetical protein [Thermocatellispora tengchongensis]